MDQSHTQELITYLEGFISDRRKARLQEVLSQRTNHLRVVLENVYQAHNASAVLRSCDCFGIQHVHFIENRNRLKISEDVAMGSSNWLSIHRHNQEDNNTIATLRELKNKGYRIVATTPHTKDVNIDQLAIDHKLALVFGTEIDGVSQEVLDLADEFVKIPMQGFTESFNVSVSAAICMYELSKRMHETKKDFGLSKEEKTEIYLDWLKVSIKNSEGLIKDYLSKQKKIGS